jgi:ubiquinone/menaquinone biosynthesis C-methylase UbiE
MTLVFTVITLQHIPSHLQQQYVKELLRVLKPGGVTVFRTLSSTSAWRFVPPRLIDVYRILKNRKKPFFGSYGLSILSVFQLIGQAGCDLVELKVSPCNGSRFNWMATQYCVVKPK